MSYPPKNDGSHVPDTDPRNGPAALTVYLLQGSYCRSLETRFCFSTWEASRCHWNSTWAQKWRCLLCWEYNEARDVHILELIKSPLASTLACRILLVQRLGLACWSHLLSTTFLIVRHQEKWTRKELCVSLPSNAESVQVTGSHIPLLASSLQLGPSRGLRPTVSWCWRWRWNGDGHVWRL